LLDKELAVVESNPEYQAALASVAAMQKPVLEQISSNIRETLREFLPNVSEVEVRIPEEARYRALRRSCEIVVNDGTPTELHRKGDGVQSLAALSLMRHASVTSGLGKNLVLALEEPESHLHPNAIHQLKGVLQEIATRHQVIMTTHCPLFVDRTSLRSNILVNNRMARPARSIQELRMALGVRAADNLQHAELILLVEGDDDRRALYALLPQASLLLADAIRQGLLAIDTLQGGSNLSYKLTLVRESMCGAYVFLDHDKAGIDGFEKAQNDGLLTQAKTTFASCEGMSESEIEDIYDVSLYSTFLQNSYGVSTQSPKFKGNAKWSDRVRNAFKHQGKHWSDKIEAKLKSEVADLVEKSPGSALNSHKRACFDALVSALDAELQMVASTKCP
jgi:hypothetical protein